MEAGSKQKKEKWYREENMGEMGEMGRKRGMKGRQRRRRKGNRRTEGSIETLSPFIELFQFQYSQRDKEVEYIKHID